MNTDPKLEPGKYYCKDYDEEETFDEGWAVLSRLVDDDGEESEEAIAYTDTESLADALMRCLTESDAKEFTAGDWYGPY